MNKILTIVIPSYNVEDTLARTVRSLLIPNYKLLESIDILIVNDGSTDGTLELARNFESQYPNIVRVWNKENGGHGSTINVGIEHALGKYIKVVDGDDWLDTESLESYIKVLQTTNVDLVATDYSRYYMNDNVTEQVKICDLPYKKVMEFDEIDKWRKYKFDMHTFSVKTSLLRNQTWRLDEHCYYEDNQLILLVAMKVRTILYLNLFLYVYCLQRPNQSVSAQGRLKHYKDFEKIIDTFIQWYHVLIYDNSVSEVKKHYFEFFMKNVLFSYYTTGLIFNKNQQIEFLIQVKAYDKHLEKEDKKLYKKMNKSKFIFLCRLFHFSPLGYSLLGKIQNIKN